MTGTQDKIKLLLVDDEKEFLDSTSRALSRRSFEVTTASNGELALQLLEEQSFDAAVLDVKMPGIPGDRLFRRIKQLYPGMPMIILTGHGTVEQAFETSRDGIFDYLTKPCDMEKLAGKIREAFLHSRLRAEEEQNRIDDIRERFRD